MSAPPVIANTLLHDYDPGSIPTPTAGASVSSLPDTVGGGAVTQATAAKQPTLQQVTLNGKTFWSVQFDGVDDYLVDASVSVSQPDTIIVIAAIGATGQQNLVNGASTNATRQIVGSHIVTGAGYFDAFAGATTLQSTTVPTLNAWFVDAVAFTASGTIILNGTQIASGNPGTQNLSGITLGASNSLGNFTTGKIARVLIYSGTLSAADQAKIDSWVQDTYGITVSDYVSSGPPSGSAAGTVTWTGSASGTTTRSGAAAGTVAWTGSASGTTTREGSAAGTVAWTGAASGTTTRSGTAAGTLTWTGSASGTAPTLGAKSGSAAGTVTWTGAASGQATHSGTADGTLTWTGTASGTTQRSGSAAGLLVWVGHVGTIPQRNITLISARGPYGHKASSTLHGRTVTARGPYGRTISARGPHT